MQDPSSDHTGNDLSEEPKQKLQMNKKKLATLTAVTSWQIKI